MIVSLRMIRDVPSKRVQIRPWGRNPLFSAQKSSRSDRECSMRGFVIARGSPYEECVCHSGFTGPDCREYIEARPTFGISYLMYGENGVEYTVERSIEITRKKMTSRHAYDFVVFHDGFPAYRRARLSKLHRVKLLQIQLPSHLNGICSCAPAGKPDIHCRQEDTAYRGMGLFRAVRQFQHPEFSKYTYVVVMDAEAHFLGGDPFSELLHVNAGFAFYAWGAINDRSCMGNVREWAIDLARGWGIDTTRFEAEYGTMRGDCLLHNRNLPAACCGVHVSSFSGDVVAFNSAVMRTKAVQKMSHSWEKTGLLQMNRSTEQELWPNLFGLLLPASAIHQFSKGVLLNAHLGYIEGATIHCTENEDVTSLASPELRVRITDEVGSGYVYDDSYATYDLSPYVSEVYYSMMPSPPPPSPSPPSPLPSLPLTN